VGRGSSFKLYLVLQRKGGEQGVSKSDWKKEKLGEQLPDLTKKRDIENELLPQEKEKRTQTHPQRRKGNDKALHHPRDCHCEKKKRSNRIPHLPPVPLVAQEGPTLVGHNGKKRTRGRKQEDHHYDTDFITKGKRKGRAGSISCLKGGGKDATVEYLREGRGGGCSPFLSGVEKREEGESSSFLIRSLPSQKRGKRGCSSEKREGGGRRGGGESTSIQGVWRRRTKKGKTSKWVTF